jgi:AcrR family transcriptional regulator
MMTDTGEVNGRLRTPSKGERIFMSLREQILQATATLIREQGIATVRTKRIAEVAGCAEGTIFNYFGNKGGLLAAVLSVGLPEVQALYEAVRQARGADLRAGLVGVVDAMHVYYRASTPIVHSALVDHTLFERYSAAHRVAGTGPQQVWQLVASYLTGERERGAIVEGPDLELEAVTLAGACQHAVWVEIVSGAEALPHGGERFVEQLVDARLPALTGAVSARP